ncbi:MAG: restriction endonuclease subunit S, partial [Geminicoccaceae bacterium]|nr:restriction endonuclease subunit S [Geminicoccaceae bacterium]
MKPLGEICRVEIGSTPSRKIAALWDKERETDNVWLSIADLPVNHHAIATESREYISDAAVPRMKVVPKGTILVSFKLTLGRVAYAGRDLYTNEAIASLHDLQENVINKTDYPLFSS